MINKNKKTFRNKKGFLEIPFGWLFAIIAGMVILFLAIFFITKFVGLGSTRIDAETAKRIDILLQPLETSFQSGRINFFVTPSETRILNKCDNTDYFGKQKIQISQKVFNKWTDTDISVSSNNKYIFSESVVEGKKFWLFSLPFSFPFKVADMIILTSQSKEYCFKDAPEEIEKVISLSDGKYVADNIKTKNCSESSVKVCFSSSSGCDIRVNMNGGYVEKEGKRLYFTSPVLDRYFEEKETGLIIAAIFSESSIYECEVKRLMQRTEQLSAIYIDKASFVGTKGCLTDLDTDLVILKIMTKNFKTSEDLELMNSIVEKINDKNEGAICKLW